MLHLSTINMIHQGVSPSSFAASGCLSPIRRTIRLCETGEQKEIFLDCGHCARCLQQRREEMASRMFLHSLDYEYCYFVTLTYGSYNLLPLKRHPFLKDWLQMIPIVTTYNKEHRPRWTPTLLVQSHVVKYIKRLRKAVNSNITYAACGEYGEDFLRPHFHLVIWSHVRITKQQFLDSWSLDCKRTDDKLLVRPWRESADLRTPENGYFKFKIGNVFVEDLWANGTLNYDGKHPGLYDSGTGKNALHNFTYVAKYIGKSGANFEPSNRLYKRFLYAYSIYSKDIDKLAELCPHPYDNQLELYNKVTNAINYDDYELQNFDFREFQKVVSPFILSSRRPALGKSYYLQNRSRFQRQEFGLPKFMGKTIQFPRYFFYLLAQDNYPLRLRKSVPSGVSLTKDLLPRLYSYVSSLREDSRFWYSVRGYRTTEKYRLIRDTRDDRVDLYSLTGCPKFSLDVETKALRLYYTDSFDCIDLLSSDNGVIHYFYNPKWDFFEGWQYNRTHRDYDFCGYFERADFCDLIINLIESEYSRFPDKLRNMDNLFDAQLSIENDPDSLSVRQNYIRLLSEYQVKYKSSHFYDL